MATMPKPREPDPTYDPSDFLISPSDARGVSYHVSFRAMPDMVRAADQIVASKKFPFGTRGDLMRYAMRDALRKLEAMEPVVSVMKRVDLINNLMAEENAHSDFMAMFVHLDETVRKYMADQAPEQAVRTITVVKHHIEAMPEGYWRERYLTELQNRYGKALALAPKGITLSLVKGALGPAGTE